MERDKNIGVDERNTTCYFIFLKLRVCVQVTQSCLTLQSMLSIHVNLQARNIGVGSLSPSRIFPNQSWTGSPPLQEIRTV